MDKKILFITSENSSTGGGAAIVNRNKSVLLDIFGDNNVSVLHLSKPTSYDLSMIMDRILYHYKCRPFCHLCIHKQQARVKYI